MVQNDSSQQETAEQATHEHEQECPWEPPAQEQDEFSGRWVMAEPKPLHVEFAAARSVYSDALKFIRALAVTAADGIPPDTVQARELARRIGDSIQRNPSALVCLTKFHYTGEYLVAHPVNVAVYSTVLASALGVHWEKWYCFGMAGLLHDVGKYKLPEALLRKTGPLSPKERLVMEQHPRLGFELFAGNGELEPDMLAAILEHHERYDGTGYPKGLKETACGQIARVLRVANTYDTLTSKHGTQKALSSRAAFGKLHQLDGTHFTPGYVKAFIECIGIYPVGSCVVLSDNRRALVGKLVPKKPRQPQLVLLTDSAGETIPPARYNPATEDVQVERLAEEWQVRQDAVAVLESVRMH